MFQIELKKPEIQKTKK